jgi:hypothetical protein
MGQMTGGLVCAPEVIRYREQISMSSTHPPVSHTSIQQAVRWASAVSALCEGKFKDTNIPAPRSARRRKAPRMIPADCRDEDGNSTSTKKRRQLLAVSPTYSIFWSFLPMD